MDVELKPQWTQDQAVAFEAARECITHMVAVCTGELAEMEEAGVSNPARVAELEALQDLLWEERRSLRVLDDANVARVRAVYGARIREIHAEQQKRAA